MSEKTNYKVTEKLNDFETINDLSSLKEFVSLFKKKDLYFKGKLGNTLHSTLYMDWKTKHDIDDDEVEIGNLIFLSKNSLKNVKDKKADSEKTDLDLLLEMERHGAPTLLIDFSSDLLNEIWLAANEVNKNGVNDDKYFHLFVIEKAYKPKNDIKDWDENQIYKHIKNVSKNIKHNSYFILENNDDIFKHYNIKKIRVNAYLKDEIIKYLYSKNINAETVYADHISPYKEVTTYGPLKLNLDGVSLDLNGDHDAAIKKYEEIIKIKPKYRGLYGNWGLALYNIKDYDGAIEKFKKSIKYGENNPEVYNNWGLTLGKLDMHKKAIQKFRMSIEKKENMAVSYNNWGISLNHLELYKKASKKFEKAIQLKINYSEANNNCGMSFASMKKWGKAIEKFEKAIEINPFYHEAIFNLEYAQSKI